jgi:hypothetical protein
MIPRNQYCGSSSTPSVKRETVCIVRKGEKQIQILDGHWMNTVVIAIMLAEYVCLWIGELRVEARRPCITSGYASKRQHHEGY